jgi:UDP-N-acetylglucosamine 1-carboxyvinyltransferase
MAAALLVPGKTVLHNVPHISDVETLLDIFRCIGVVAGFRPDGGLEIDATNITTTTRTPHHLVRQMRASFNILGSLLARFGRASVAMPGGCDIGARPVNFHIKGLEQLGCKFTFEHGIYTGEVDRFVGTNLYLEFPSAGATQHLMIAASMAKGRTVIENCAAEPEIVDLADFLNACGAQINGAGTAAITIDGVESLHPVEFTVIPDRLQAGTFALATAITGGDVLIRNAVMEHCKPLLMKLDEIGVEVLPDASAFGYRVRRTGKLDPTHVTTMPHPGFPTDMQQPLAALLCLACGTSTITETVYESRFRYTTELAKLGADIRVEGRTAIITGVERLTGATVTCTDLRGGAAVLVAGLAAEGYTEIEGLAHLDRGYENIVPRLRGLGADITRGTERVVAGGLRICSA